MVQDDLESAIELQLGLRILRAVVLGVEDLAHRPLQNTAYRCILKRQPAALSGALRSQWERQRQCLRRHPLLVVWLGRGRIDPEHQRVRRDR